MRKTEKKKSYWKVYVVVVIIAIVIVLIPQAIKIYDLRVEALNEIKLMKEIANAVEDKNVGYCRKSELEKYCIFKMAKTNNEIRYCALFDDFFQLYCEAYYYDNISMCDDYGIDEIKTDCENKIGAINSIDEMFKSKGVIIE
jgi:hypothetical protein